MIAGIIILGLLIILNHVSIMSKITDLAASLAAINAQLEKARAEIVAAVDALQNQDLPPEAQAQLDRLTAVAQSLDDLNPDTPTPSPTP